MAALLVFLTMAVVSWADPIALVGYLAVGLLTRRYAMALAGGTAWALALIGLRHVLAQAEQSHIPIQSDVALVFGGLLAVSIIYGIARSVRARRRSASTFASDVEAPYISRGPLGPRPDQ